MVDELILYIAPVLLGADAAPLAALTGLPGAGRAAAEFDIVDTERFGADLRLRMRPRAATVGES